MLLNIGNFSSEQPDVAFFARVDHTWFETLIHTRNIPNKPKFFKLNNNGSNKLRSDVEKMSATSEFESRNTESERKKNERKEASEHEPYKSQRNGLNRYTTRTSKLKPRMYSESFALNLTVECRAFLPSKKFTSDTEMYLISFCRPAQDSGRKSREDWRDGSLSNLKTHNVLFPDVHANISISTCIFSPPKRPGSARKTAQCAN